MKKVFLARRDGVAKQRLGGGWVSIWLPPAVACLVIGFESTARMSAAHTSLILRPLVQALFGHMSDPVWDEVHHLIRKSGHFLGYGLVCLTFLRAWLMTLAPRTVWRDGAWRTRCTLLAIACTFLVASCDELHQFYTPGRTGLFSDVLLDTAGASVMCLLVAVASGWFSKVRKPLPVAALR